MFLAQMLGALYIINNVDDEDIRSRASVRLVGCTVLFLVFFLAFFVRLLLKDGYAVDAQGVVFMEPMKYLHNYLAMPLLAVLTLVGVVLLLYGVGRTVSATRTLKASAGRHRRGAGGSLASARRRTRWNSLLSL